MRTHHCGSRPRQAKFDWSLRLALAAKEGGPRRVRAAANRTVSGNAGKNVAAVRLPDGAFGKWHLGLGYAVRRGTELDFGLPLPWREASRQFEEQVDFDSPITEGPLQVGFDEFFGTSGCPTCQPPYGFISGDRFVDPPCRYDERPPYTGRPGMASPGWRHQDADPTIIDEACRFIASSAEAVRPFFAYVALYDPHEPAIRN